MGTSREYSFTVVTPASKEPVSLEEMKSYLTIDSSVTTDDMDIKNWIREAREQVEARTGRKLMSQVLSMKRDAFYAYEIKIKCAPVTAINSVSYQDIDDITQSLTGSPMEYRAFFDEDSESWIEPESGWPATYPRPQSVDINFTVGYSNVDSIPEALKNAIKMLVAHRYEFREPVIAGTIVSDVSMAVNFTLDPYRVYYND